MINDLVEFARRFEGEIEPFCDLSLRGQTKSKATRRPEDLLKGT